MARVCLVDKIPHVIFTIAEFRVLVEVFLTTNKLQNDSVFLEYLKMNNITDDGYVCLQIGLSVARSVSVSDGSVTVPIVDANIFSFSRLKYNF
jgi:hypothetical protein